MEYIANSDKEILIEFTPDADGQAKREERLTTYEKAIMKSKEGETGTAD